MFNNSIFIFYYKINLITFTAKIRLIFYINLLLTIEAF